MKRVKPETNKQRTKRTSQKAADDEVKSYCWWHFRSELIQPEDKRIKQTKDSQTLSLTDTEMVLVCWHLTVALIQSVIHPSIHPSMHAYLSTHACSFFPLTNHSTNHSFPSTTLYNYLSILQFILPCINLSIHPHTYSIAKLLICLYYLSIYLSSIHHSINLSILSIYSSTHCSYSHRFIYSFLTTSGLFLHPSQWLTISPTWIHPSIFAPAIYGN